MASAEEKQGAISYDRRTPTLTRGCVRLFFVYVEESKGDREEYKKSVEGYNLQIHSKIKHLKFEKD